MFTDFLIKTNNSVNKKLEVTSKLCTTDYFIGLFIKLKYAKQSSEKLLTILLFYVNRENHVINIIIYINSKIIYNANNITFSKYKRYYKKINIKCKMI